MVVNNHPIGYADSSEIYVTYDKGAKWERRQVPFEMNGANLKFHQKNPDAILATDASSGKLYATDDFGKTWSAVHDSGRTHSYKWDNTDESGKTFFYTHDPTGLGTWGSCTFSSFCNFAVKSNLHDILGILRPY